MNHFFFLALVFFLLCCPYTVAQEKDGKNIHSDRNTVLNKGNVPWEDWLYELTAVDEDTEGIDDASWEEWHDIVGGFAANPIDINTATREDLERIPFLTDRQVEDICEYLYRYGPMKTTAELAMIESLDRTRRQLLEYLVYIGKDGGKGAFPSLREMLKYGRHTLVATAKIPFYRRKGDINGYLGYPYKHWLRYDFSCRDRVRFGMVASQDAGEPMFAGKNTTGYDYYSLYLQLRQLGCIESLTVGRYRVSFGMGLVAGTSFNLGKTTVLAGLGHRANAIRVHSSRSEADYMQGAAVTLRLAGHFKASAFASYRPLDATLNKDGTVATIVKSGYHRTMGEMEKKNNTHATTAGANVHYAANGFHAGISAVYTGLDRRLSPDTKVLYRRHYATGRDFINAGAYYGYRNHLLSFQGETATDRHGAVATIHSATVYPDDRFNVTVLHRYYSRRYSSLHAASFSDGNRVQNEHGIYAGTEWRPTPRVQMSAYSDLAYFGWPKYQTSGTSYSSDNMLAATLSHRDWTFSGRYRLRIRQRDNDAKTALICCTEHRLRLAVACSSAGGWDAKTQLDLALTEFKRSDRGLMVTQYVNGSFNNIHVSTNVSYFNTTGYDSRLYAYERTMPYSFYSRAYSGHGIRYALMARIVLWRRMTVAAKVAVTDYFDRSSVGSSYQTVYRSSMTDMEVQAGIKL